MVKPEVRAKIRRRHQERLAAKRWADNSIQFPRLLAEIYALDMLRMPYLLQLYEAMDLTAEQVDEIFQRADAAWDEIKERTR